MTKFWILREGKIVGPFAPHELSSRAEFDEDTLVCAERDVGASVSSWVPAGLRGEFTALFAERRRRSRFWVYIEGRVIGPVAARDLWALNGFESGTLVCRDGGHGPQAWTPADRFPELLETMPRPRGPLALQAEGGEEPPQRAVATEVVAPKDMLEYVESAQRANYMMFRETRRKLGALERALFELKSELGAAVDVGELRKSLADVQGSLEKLRKDMPDASKEADAARRERADAAEALRDAYQAIRSLQETFEGKFSTLESKVKDELSRAREELREKAEALAAKTPPEGGQDVPLPRDAAEAPAPSAPALPELKPLAPRAAAETFVPAFGEPAASLAPVEESVLPVFQAGPVPIPVPETASAPDEPKRPAYAAERIVEDDAPIEPASAPEAAPDLSPFPSRDENGDKPEPAAPTAAGEPVAEAISFDLRPSEPPPLPEPAPPAAKGPSRAALAAGAAGLVVVLAFAGLRGRGERAEAPAPVPADTKLTSVPGEEVAINLVKRHVVEGSDATIEAELARAGARNPASWSARRDIDGTVEVAFSSERIDPETGGPLVYLFRVDPAKGTVQGGNLPGRTILREP